MSNQSHKISIINAIRLSSLTASIGLVGGVWLQNVQDKLIHVTPLLIALPALNAMIGDLASIITAHISDPESSPYTRKKLYQTLGVVVPVSAIGVFLVSLFVAWLQEYEVTSQFMMRYGLLILTIFTVAITSTIGLSIFKSRALAAQHAEIDEALIPLSGVTASVIILILVSLGLFLFLT